MRVVPSIDVRGGVAVLRGGASRGDPVSLAMRTVAEGARELHLVDLDQAERDVPANRALLAAVARAASVPCRLAGGISAVEDAVAALGDGFAGVLFSSAVFRDDALLPRIAELGDRAIVELEVRDGALDPRGGARDLA
ncbi:MAG: HisA/HisF-related TIM barrel protein, partial [Candidatus Limnocylindria bacterium]